ncbi:MAG: hypothetical protein K9N06_08555 [Candidatus Cloacimonetes bacterium]|nr:hypothetical protein [Candidatus Cloacimonadota bacterium]
MNYRERTLKWWSNLRWFMILIVMCVGSLEILKSKTTYQPLVYLGVFGGLIALNLYFHLHQRQESKFAIIIQIILDVIFATLSVHLTGGPSSYFSWLYLIPVITASLLIPKTGGVTTGMIGTFSLLGLLALYRLGILDAPTTTPDGFGTIFLLSFTGLFCIAGFVVNYLNDLSIDAGHDVTRSEHELSVLTENLDNVLIENKRLEKIVADASKIIWLDRDINTHLCVISLTLKKFKRIAIELENDELATASNDISDSVNKIIVILELMEKFRQESGIKIEE